MFFLDVVVVVVVTFLHIIFRNKCWLILDDVCARRRAHSRANPTYTRMDICTSFLQGEERKKRVRERASAH